MGILGDSSPYAEMNKLLHHPIIKSILFWVLFVLSLNVGYIVSSFLPEGLRHYGLGVLGTLFAAGLTYGALKLEGRTFRDIGLRWEALTLPRFLGGFAGGAVVFGLIIAGIVLLTPMKLVMAPSPDLSGALVVATLALIPQAWMEEVAFRGYPLVVLEKQYGVRTAIYAGGFAFAMYHFIPAGNLVGALLGTGIWGIAYGYMAIRTGGIAFPVGFHYALNLSQAVTGMKAPYPALWQLREADATPEAAPFTMDQVGLGAQLIVLVACVVLIELMVRGRR
ncbi:CPBP family intramembrane glutamic endopeptidase [Roseivirga sp. BDSF3-8]|uniref:CPBP family intramembrane glutamic endopeptidase n=1 Tax=Roseivirga sp. BDSF3-8 TaxID=3241598 RepID=UPI0035324046